MADASHLGTQFHEMTPDEFGAQPGTWFHGTATGDPGSGGGSFHVGERRAAEDALNARVGPGRDKLITASGGKKIWAGDPKVVPGRIVGPMTNTPHLSPSRGPGNHWEHREGIPRGEMSEWPRLDSSEPHSDVRANAIERGAQTSGRPLKRGFYYINAAEGSGSDLSAVLPNRQHFKTHEDYVVEARAQGKKIPEHVAAHYKEIPGQGKLF